MILNQSVVDSLKKNKAVKSDLVVALDKHFGTIERLLNQNIKNGPLTTFAAVEIIKKATGLTEDQILEKDTVPA